MTVTNLCAQCDAVLVTQNPPSKAVRLRQLRSVLGAPSSAEVNGILQSLESCHHDLALYDKEFAKVYIIFKNLCQGRANLEEYMKEQCSLLAPVRKLPPEILTSIFSFCIGEYGLAITKRGDGSLKIVASTLRLAQVCTFWRNTVFSCSSLWSGLRVDLAHPVGYQQDCIRELVNLYISASQDSCLNLRLDALIHEGKVVAYANLDQCSRTIIQLLLLTRQRWQRVVVNLSEDICILDYLLGSLDTYNSLETVEVGKAISYFPPDDQSETLLEGLLGDAPKFHELVLSGRNAREILLDDPVDLDKITSLTLQSGYYNVWQLISIAIMSCPSLESFSVCIDHNPQRPHDHNVPQCVSSSLKSLSMKVESLLVASEVMPALVLPSLTDLDLSLDSFWEPETMRLLWMRNFATMLRQSSCHLRSLKLVCGHLFSTSEILELLSCVPTITHLALDADCQILSDVFFTEMKLPPSNHLSVTSGHESSTENSEPKLPLLPRLKSLVIHLADLYSRPTPELPDPDIIITMVISRRIATPVLPQGSDYQYSGLVNANELVHLALYAPARACSASERDWAQQLRSMMESRLRGHRTNPWTQRPLTCLLDLGEF